MSFADHTRSLPVDRSLDQRWHLNTLVVADSILYQVTVVDSVDGRRQDNERSNIRLSVSFKDHQVYVSVQSSIGK